MTLFRQFTFLLAALVAATLAGGIVPALAKDNSAAGTFQVAQAALTPEEIAERKRSFVS